MYTLNIVTDNEKSSFRNYFNAYLIELSAYDKGIEFDDNHLPIYKYFDYYFVDDDRYAFWLCKDNMKIGIAMVREMDHHLFEIAEFMIFKDYRKDGNALNLAREIVNYFDGDFCFSTDLNNIIAVKFWDKFSENYKFTSHNDEERKEWYIRK